MPDFLAVTKQTAIRVVSPSSLIPLAPWPLEISSELQVLTTTSLWGLNDAFCSYSSGPPLRPGPRMPSVHISWKLS